MHAANEEDLPMRLLVDHALGNNSLPPWNGRPQGLRLPAGLPTHASISVDLSKQ